MKRGYIFLNVVLVLLLSGCSPMLSPDTTDIRPPDHDGCQGKKVLLQEGMSTTF